MADVIKKEPIEEYGMSKKDRTKSLFSKVGVIGCGNVGQVITLSIASRGLEVVFLETDQERIHQSNQSITTELDNKINHWGMTESEKRAILSRIKATIAYGDLKDCDVVIEAILSHDMNTKDVRKDIFRKIEEHISPDAIIATNSSTVLVTELSSELKHKERCVSLHVSTTAPDASVIEVVKGLHTSDETYEKAKLFAKLIGKTPIEVQEAPGLVTVRLFVPLINEACEMLMEGVAKMEDIDFAVKNGFGLPLGPFEMADKIGLDKIVRWMDNLYSEFGDVKYKASPMIKRLFRADHLGRKTGQGFYRYDKDGKKIVQK